MPQARLVCPIANTDRFAVIEPRVSVHHARQARTDGQGNPSLENEGWRTTFLAPVFAHASRSPYPRKRERDEEQNE